MKNYKFYSIYILLIFTLSMLSSCAYFSYQNYSYYIFSDVQECQDILNENDDNGQIVSHDTPENDSFLRELAYSEFYAINYSSSQLTFELFAYEFENDTVTSQYFYNATGKRTDDAVDFSAGSGLSFYHLIVIDHKNAYYVQCPVEQADTLHIFLESTFSKKLFSTK